MRNNSTLQQLRRRVALGAKTTVQLRYNPALMNRIWVEDPVTHERFEVLNTDPVTRDLSAKQVAAIESLHRKSQSTSTIVTRAQARKQIVDLYRPLLLAKTMTERRRAFKIMGLLTNEELPHKPPKAAPKKREKKQAAPTTASVAQTTESKNADHVDLPIQLNVVVSPAASPPVFKIVRQDAVHYASKTSNQEISNDGSH